MLGLQSEYQQSQQAEAALAVLLKGMHYVFNRELRSTEKELSVMPVRGDRKLAQSKQDQVGKVLAKDVLQRPGR
jgi:hypothetical protein